MDGDERDQPMTPVDLILSRLPDAKRNGKGWMARCPAHDDRRASLSIGAGDDGRALIHCHAGCTAESIVAAMGLTLADLMPADGRRTGRSVRPRPRPKVKSNKRGKDEQEVYATAADAVTELERRHGPSSASWTYHGANGEPVGVILRWDTAGGKEIRPVSKTANGWIIGGMPEPRPLSRLPELLARPNERVYVCEGEKAADAATTIGLLATTSPHGSESAAKADWRCLAGREVVILPDNDDAGRRYAQDVVSILLRLQPAAKVKIVELPGLPEKGDMVEFVEHCRAAHQDDAAIRGDLDTLIARTPAARAGDKLPTACIDPFMPFPLDALPEPVRSFVAGGAKAIGCDPSFIALPLLAGLASAIGNTRRIKIKRSWSEPAIIWGAIVGESGTLKSPALETALRPVRKRQCTAMKEYDRAMERYESAVMQYEKDLLLWKRSKERGDPPTKPKPPAVERGWCDDTTIEALAVLLQQNWRGLLLVRDELSGWLGSFDRYSQGKGADAAKWLEVFGGRSIMVDRKTGASKIIYVPRAAVSVAGGIQPGVLRRALGVEHRENGLAARLLLTCPPRLPKRWTEDDISPDLERQMACIFEKLYSLQPIADEEGEPQPLYLPLTRDAKSEWIRFYNEHALEQADLTGDLAAVWSKIEGYAPRLALIVHFVRWAADDATLAATDAVDLVSMEAGISLAKWFGTEARRVYAILGESDEERDQRRLVELIQRKGAVTVRDLMRSARMFSDADVAEQALNELVKAGLGHWEAPPIGPAGGHPTQRFVFAPGVDTDTTLDSSMVSGVVSTSTVSTGMDYSDEQEERAAILEYDGNLPREAADERAFRSEEGA
jgi:hypothetical protein